MGLIPGGVNDRVLVEQAVERLRGEADDPFKKISLDKLDKLLRESPDIDGREMWIDLSIAGDSFFWTIASVMYGSTVFSVSIPFADLSLIVEQFRENGLMAEAYKAYEKNELNKLAFIKKDLLGDAVAQPA